MSTRVTAALLLVLATPTLPGCFWKAWQNDDVAEGTSPSPSDPSAPGGASSSTPAGYEAPSPLDETWEAFMSEAPAAAPRYLDTLEGTWTGAVTEGVDLRIRVEGGAMTIGVRCADRSGGLEVSAQVRETGSSYEVVFPSSAKTEVRSTVSDRTQHTCELGVAAGRTSVYLSRGSISATFLEGSVEVQTSSSGSPSYFGSVSTVSLAKISD